MTDLASLEHILVEVEGPLLWITLNRPEVRNALHPSAHRELHRIFDAYAADPTLRVAILTGAGERAFCAGSDIKARARTNADDYPPTGYAGLTARFDLDKPVIAAVNGFALGGGAEIVLACDMAYAADHAEFGFPEPRVGLAALGGGGLQRLARSLPTKFAMDLALTGRRVSAAEAKTLGLINDHVPAAELRSKVRDVAHMIVANAPLAIEASKAIIRDCLASPDLAASMSRSYPAAIRMLESRDAIEGQSAFLERREPNWLYE